MSENPNAHARTGVPCLPFHQWPPAHQAAWTASLEPGDLLEGLGGVTACWSSATWEMAMRGYGRWLSWMMREKLLEPQAAPGAQMTREIVSRYLDDLKETVAPFTVSTQLQQLGNAMRAMVPEKDWRWIQRGADRVRATATSIRDKRAHLQSPLQLIALGFKLMANADDVHDRSMVERATTFRDGLIIALLAHRPLRRSNLVAIECGRHLEKRGESWWLVFQSDEMKSRRAHETILPRELDPALQRYLAVYRPVLLAAGHRERGPVKGLWVSRSGSQLSSAALYHQIRDRTRTEFGAPINPHMFRDCAATEIAISAPDHVGAIKGILDHSGMATSERHYNLAGSLEAARRYSKTIGGLRDG